MTPSDGTKFELETWRCSHCGKTVMTEVKVSTENYRWAQPPAGWLAPASSSYIVPRIFACSVECASEIG